LPRAGLTPKSTFAADRLQETSLIVARLRWLVEEQEVRPQDVLVLTFTRDRATQLAAAISAAQIVGVDAVHVPFTEKDRLLGQKGRLTVSTVASAKGYDAYCVLLASVNEFPTDIIGRTNFYVGCTRAVEYLEVSACEKSGLVNEVTEAMHRTSVPSV